MKVLFLIFCFVTTSIFAHHGPEHQVKILSEKIAEKPQSSLLLARAGLYMEQGKKALALKDAKKALELNPASKSGQKILAQLQAK
ncbi:MAG: hypothetical protein NE334_16205 [Lentisphaeraceae bacterium]|nr:hypothetical protein [Lentisphaeraceae bacterium]